MLSNSMLTNYNSNLIMLHSAPEKFWPHLKMYRANGLLTLKAMSDKTASRYR